MVHFLSDSFVDQKYDTGLMAFLSGDSKKASISLTFPVSSSHPDSLVNGPLPPSSEPVTLQLSDLSPVLYFPLTTAPQKKLSAFKYLCDQVLLSQITQNSCPFSRFLNPISCPEFVFQFKVTHKLQGFEHPHVGVG